MDFGLSEEKRLFRETVSKFARQEVAPIIEGLEETDEFPTKLFKKMGELGFLGIPFPDKYGGSEGDTMTLCILAEEIAYFSVALAVSCIVQTLGVAGPVFSFGTEEQKESILIPSIKAEKIGAIAMTEPEAGSDVASIRTTALKDGNDDYIINGTKMFCTMGNVADLYFVTAVTDPKKGIKGISLFVVERGTSGVRVSPNIKKLGLHGAGTVELSFEDCKVSKGNLLGEENRGFYNLMRALERNRILVGIVGIGLARAAFDEANKYSKERVQFGKSISNFQAVQFMLADMAMEIELATLMAYKTAWMYDQGQKCNKEASMTKLYCSEMANRVATNALQIHGGYGYMMEYNVQRYFRDARALEIFEGTSQIQRGIIARELGL